MYRVQEAQGEPWGGGRLAEAGHLWKLGSLRDARDPVELFRHPAPLGPFFPQNGFSKCFSAFSPSARFLEGKPTTGC